MTPKRVLFVRTTSEVHRAADETATRLGLSLNAFCVEAILKAVEHHSPTPEGIETNVEVPRRRQRQIDCGNASREQEIGTGLEAETIAQEIEANKV